MNFVKNTGVYDAQSSKSPIFYICARSLPLPSLWAFLGNFLIFLMIIAIWIMICFPDYLIRHTRDSICSVRFIALGGSYIFYIIYRIVLSETCVYFRFFAK